MTRARTNSAAGPTGDAQLQKYIARVNRYPRLERAEELDLARRFKQGDQSAGDKIARSHLRFALAAALKYRGYGLPIFDLIAEGNVGIAVALARFDPERGFRFVTYASHWVRAYIVEYILRFRSSMVGGKGNAIRSRHFFGLRRERARIMGHTRDNDQVEIRLAERFGTTREKVVEMLQRIDSRDVFLDGLDPNQATELCNGLVVTETQEKELDDCERALWAREVVREALVELDERDRFIAERRLMAAPEDELTLADVGRHFGVSRERARQLEARLKRRLRDRITPQLPDAA